MPTLRNIQNGSPAWDDAAPESRIRRMQQVRGADGKPSARAATTRPLPGMPLEMQDDGDDDLPRRRRLFENPSGPWYRPVTTFRRVLLGTGVVLVVCTLVTAYELTAHALKRDSRFRIASSQNIQASGLGEVSRADLLPVFGEDIGKNVFFIHLSERRKQLEQIPWVQHATVMRLLPDQIRVSLVERTPIAFVRQGQQIGLVDADGVVLSMPAAGMTQHHYSFPVVTGIDPRDPQPSRRARMATYQRLIRDLDSTGQHYSDQISEIDLTDPEDARVLMPEQGADILAHFGDDQFLARFQRYKARIAEWRQQYPHLAAIDLRYEHQAVLEMAPGTGVAQQAVSAADGKPVESSPETTAQRPAGKPSAATHVAANHVATTHPAAKPAKAAHAAAHGRPVTHAKPRTHAAALQKHPAHILHPNTRPASLRQGQ